MYVHERGRERERKYIYTESNEKREKEKERGETGAQRERERVKKKWRGEPGRGHFEPIVDDRCRCQRRTLQSSTLFGYKKRKHL